MKGSARVWSMAAILAAGVVAGVVADQWWHTRSAETGNDAKPNAEKAKPGDDEEEPEPAAIVHTVIAASGELPRIVDALGTAAVPPTATTIESWPNDLLIARVLVQPGESVAKDTPLLQVVLTRDTETQLAAAELSIQSTTRALESVQQRLERGLATRTDLLAAQSAQAEAKQKLERLQTGQPPKDGLLKSHSAGTVTAVRAQPGATVTAGSPLIDIADDSVVAQIGVDPADAAGVKMGQVFDLTPVDERSPGRWKGKVSLLARVVNPMTRLLDATLTLEGDAPLRPGTALKAHASLEGEKGVLIPRSAIVFDGEEMIVFIVKDGTAVRSSIQVALTGREQVAVTSGCTSGDHVIISGQSQLAPGATVREVTAQDKTQPHSGGAGADR